jgi:hypothetical protein
MMQESFVADCEWDTRQNLSHATSSIPIDLRSNGPTQTLVRRLRSFFFLVCTYENCTLNVFAMFKVIMLTR